MFSYSESWSIRLSVRTVGFQSTKSGSTPLCSTKLWRSGCCGICYPPSFVSVDVEKAWCRKPCEFTVRVRYYGNRQVSTITTYLYPVRGFTENTGRMAAMSEVLLLTNSIRKNQVESKSHKVNSRRLGYHGRLCSVYCVSLKKLRNTGVRVPK